MIAHALTLCATFVVASAWSPGGFPNQLGRVPPRGWRSWIAYVHDADQPKMEAAMDSIHKPRLFGGKNTSLQDLGYVDVGLDGGWARCDGVNKTYHDAAGWPIVNHSKFPSFPAMNRRAHSLGLTSSWYLNCDQCKEAFTTDSATTEAWYSHDARQAAIFEFDGIKFDTQSGGPNWNITRWAIAVNATGRPMVIEDCLDKHPDGTILPKSHHPSIDILHDPAECPFNFYRTGGDNSPSFLHGMEHTLVDLLPFLNDTESGVRMSRPGCFAYPDMLSIGKGVMQQGYLDAGCPALSMHEERTLYANWAIVSSPLILSFDVTDDAEVERLWPIIANKRALDINTQWAGEAGRLLKRSARDMNVTFCIWNARQKKATLPEWAVWSKRLSHPKHGMAVLAVNVADSPQSISLSFEELLSAAGPGVGGKKMFEATDVWSGEVIARVSKEMPWQVQHLEPHDSRFVVFAPAA